MTDSKASAASVDTSAVDKAAQGREAAGKHAASMVRDGMLLGLGTGRTASAFVRSLGARVRDEGLRVKGVPTSEATAALAREVGVALTTLEENPTLDLAVDGADAVDPALGCIKGLGGALLREKIVAAACARFVVIVSSDKLVEHLGMGPHVPVEVVRFGWSRTRKTLEDLGAKTTIRGGESAPFVTDGGNLIVDCRFDAKADPGALAASIKALTGVVEHGYFLRMATELIVAGLDGGIELRTPRAG